MVKEGKHKPVTCLLWPEGSTLTETKAPVKGLIQS